MRILESVIRIKHGRAASSFTYVLVEGAARGYFAKRLRGIRDPRYVVDYGVRLDFHEALQQFPDIEITEFSAEVR